MDSVRIIIAGGGAAGFFAAIRCKEQAPQADVLLVEKSRELLAKVVISGGGRCNVTHACFDPAVLVKHYPRGHRELLGPFHRFNPTHTVDWFESRGVPLKTEADGRMFPESNTSETIMQCLLDEAKRVGVQIRTQCGIRAADWNEGTAQFSLSFTDGSQDRCDFLLLATGGNRRSGGLEVAEALGHAIREPVPSLFTFHINDPLLDGLSGITVESVEASVEGTALCQQGPLLVTHWGASGPAILKLSAWGARELAACDYRFALLVNWLPDLSIQDLEDTLAEHRRAHGTRHVIKYTPFPGIPRRLWERFVTTVGIPATTTWSQLSRDHVASLCRSLSATRFPVTGKSMNKEEFVTCGGVALDEINMTTMQSRLRPGLFFAGEILDIDGVTGGFNFQAAWTGGHLAGTALAEGLNLISSADSS